VEVKKIRSQNPAVLVEKPGIEGMRFGEANSKIAQISLTPAYGAVRRALVVSYAR
jgi:hypothetical protein